MKLIGYKYRHKFLIRGSKRKRQKPITILVFRRSGTSKGQHVYVGRQCEPNFSDVVVVTDRGKTIGGRREIDRDIMRVTWTPTNIPACPSAKVCYVYWGKK